MMRRMASISLLTRDGNKSTFAPAKSKYVQHFPGGYKVESEVPAGTPVPFQAPAMPYYGTPVPGYATPYHGMATPYAYPGWNPYNGAYPGYGGAYTPYNPAYASSKSLLLIL